MLAQLVIPTVPAWLLGLGTLATPFVIAWNNRRHQTTDTAARAQAEAQAELEKRVRVLENGFAALAARLDDTNKWLERIHKDLSK